MTEWGFPVPMKGGSCMKVSLFILTVESMNGQTPGERSYFSKSGIRPKSLTEFFQKKVKKGAVKPTG